MSRPARGIGIAVVGAAIVLAGCGADGPDGYSQTVEAAPAETRPPRTLPSTTVAEPDAPPPVTFPRNGDVVQVRSLDNSFRPEDVEIVAGTELWWTNNGRNEHNVLPTDDAETWGVEVDDFQPGDEYRLVFDTPGVFAYYCSIHGTKEVGMIGTVIVSAPGA